MIIDETLAAPVRSWVLNKETCQWEPPVARPTDDKLYEWNENNKSWTEIDN